MSFITQKQESLDIKNERKRIFVTQLRYCHFLDYKFIIKSLIVYLIQKLFNEQGQFQLGLELVVALQYLIFFFYNRDDEEDELFVSETNNIIQKIPIVKEVCCVNFICFELMIILFILLSPSISCLLKAKQTPL